MAAQRAATIDVWLLALANVSVLCLLVLLGLDDLAEDGLWRLGYWSGSVFCFAFWLALGTAKWWHRVGQSLLVTSGPMLLVWLQQQGTGSWLLLLAVGTGVFALLRMLRIRMAADDHEVRGGWRCSMLDLLVLMAIVGATFKLWQAENMFGFNRPSQRWDDIKRELGAYAVLATHGGLLILPSLWVLLGRQRLSFARGLLAIAATLVIAAFDCWLIPLFLNWRWELPEMTELWEFWLEYVWAPQLALVTVAFANGLTWRLLGWRLVRVQRTLLMDA